MVSGTAIPRVQLLVLTIDADLSKFAALHPGGESVLYALPSLSSSQEHKLTRSGRFDATVAGKDSTEVFFGLHRASVLEKYQRLVIGVIESETPKIILPQVCHCQNHETTS
jgi:hypothetical protein